MTPSRATTTRRRFTTRPPPRRSKRCAPDPATCRASGRGHLSDQQVADIVAYVTGPIEKPDNHGGIGLGGVGPVAEGFIALLIGVGGLMLVAYWLGDRSPS